MSYHYFGNEDEALPQDVQHLIVEASVQVIPAEFSFFRFRRLTRVDLSDGIQTIGSLAFGWCNLLTRIVIPASVTVIEEGAFESCISLESVILVDGDDDPSCLVTIGERAFNCCEALEEITIPSSVKRIQDYAFRRCISLVQVSFREGLKVIGCGSFQECTSLERVNLPETVETLRSEAFRECSALWEVNLSEKLNEIRSRTFYGCSALSVVNMATNKRLVTGTGIFEQGDHQTPPSIYTGVKVIGEYAFCGCEGLTSIALPPSVTNVERGAFQDCSNLVSVELAQHSSTNVMSIEYFAFYCCVSLVNISMPVTTAEVAGFGSCTLLCEKYGAANLPNALMRRFDGYPIHRKCYHASATTADDLIREIQSNEGLVYGDDYKQALVDPFGMTPFHMLLSAANGANRADLLRILLFSFPPHVLGWKDSFGMLAVEYCWEYQWNEDARRLIRMILRRWMVGSIAGWGGLQSWKPHMSTFIELFLAEKDDEMSNTLFKYLQFKLAQLEVWEKISLLDLKLWKTEMTKHSDNDDMGGTITEYDRETCRIQCGTSVVLPNVFGFLFIEPTWAFS
ncbi:unnamed protein product [Cylindrotheca closterium]|uniref:Uncharacterized protein n=1 Tax=Cylindrotheca closterium TaxID=2856 RepID=A0AAD2FXK6_9STRA|nr:unnamed protein product [Cylindrotheca closterium]